ncbi:MAG: amino acid permease [Bacteriovoracaceae bacterium]|nr:amino acid permease [Bacteriovoracaceae bacterium]
MSEKKLGIVSGTSYAVGSIIGSGILFLPSLTYKLSGPDVFLSWLLATILCVPLLLVFYDMSKVTKAGDGVKGFIEHGLGKTVASCFPVLLLSTVCIGMPSSALIVGKFIKDYFGINGIDYAVAFYLLLFGVVSNLLGKSIGVKIQNFVSIGFIIVGIGLFFFTLPSASGNFDKIIPAFKFKETFAGITMAFWAFAGFENLSFLTKDFQRPEKDFLLSMILALIICGVLYLALTANYAAIIPYENIETVMGIFQLSKVVKPQAVSSLIIAVLAFLALKTNFNSWVKGLGQMIANASHDGNLPRFLGKTQNAPTYLLGSLFSVSLFLSLIFPEFLETGLVIVSSNFVTIYVLTLLSYLKGKWSISRKIMAFVTLVILGTSLGTSGMKLFYPLIVFSLTYLIFKFKVRKELAIVCLLVISPSLFASSRPLDIALIFRFNDKFNGTIESLDRGIELAAKDFEKKHKIKINLKKYPHDEKLASVADATQRAIKDGHFIIIGGENSDEAMAISEIIKNKNIVLMTPTSTNPKVTLDRPFNFRTSISDDKVAEKIAEFVFKELKGKAVGVLHNVSYPYSDYLSKRFISRYNELIETSQSYGDARPKLVDQKIVRNQMDVSKEVAFFKKNGITHLVALTFNSDLLRFYSEATIQDFNPKYIGSDGWGLSEAILKAVQANRFASQFEAYRNVYWNGTDTSSQNTTFKNDYKKMFNEEANPWGAIGYDSLSIVAEAAISIKDGRNGEKLQQALKKYSSQNLLTSSSFSFDQNNTPNKDVIIYKIDKKGIGFYGTR